MATLDWMFVSFRSNLGEHICWVMLRCCQSGYVIICYCYFCIAAGATARLEAISGNLERPSFNRGEVGPQHSLSATYSTVLRMMISTPSHIDSYDSYDPPQSRGVSISLLDLNAFQKTKYPRASHQWFWTGEAFGWRNTSIRLLLNHQETTACLALNSNCEWKRQSVRHLLEPVQRCLPGRRYDSQVVTGNIRQILS